MAARHSSFGLSVGVDFHTWDGIFQGLRSHVLGIYKAAIRQAPDIRFVFFLHGVDTLRGEHPEFNAPNVELVKVPSLPGLLRLTVILPWLQRRHRLDVLHTQYRVPLLPLGRTACTMHDVLFETHPRFFKPGFVRQSKLTYRLAARTASSVLTVSEFSRQEICRLYGLAPHQVAVTYNGVDRQRFHPSPGGEDTVAALGLAPGRYILTVGRLEPRKNHVSLIRAWEQLGPGRLPLVIVGQRDFSFDGVIEAMASAETSQRIVLLESVSDEALPALLRHAALFAYPAFAEGFGMPVAEAMASGVPVVTSNSTSLPEVAGDGALLVDPHQVASIRDGMARVLGDDKLRQQLIQNALHRVRQFDWETSAQVLLSRFRTLAPRQG